MSIYDRYEKGLKCLKEKLGEDHGRYDEFLVLESRLLENIDRARKYGDNETSKTDRAAIVDALNRLALETAKTSFNELCDGTNRRNPDEPLDTPSKRGTCIGWIGSQMVVLHMWYDNLSTPQRAITIVVLIGLVGTLGSVFSSVMPELLSRLAPTSTSTSTSTDTPAATPTASLFPTTTLALSLTPTAKAPAPLVTAMPTERLAPTPLPTIAPTLTITAAPIANPTPTMTSPISIGVEIVVDDADPGFKRFGNEDYWQSCAYPKAVGGSMQWTRGVIKLENYGLWCPELPCSGLYEVYVHIPNTHATIEDACYRVHCQEGTLPQIVGTPILINQAKTRDDWARLGLFWFDSGGEDCVSLVDVTEISSPDEGSFYVGFDAMRWVLRDFSPQPEQ